MNSAPCKGVSVILILTRGAVNPSSHSQSVSLHAGPATVLKNQRCKLLRFEGGSMSALLLCGSFTPNSATDDIIGSCEADGPHVPGIPTDCFSSNRHAVKPQGACGASGHVHKWLKLNLNINNNLTALSH